MPYPRSVRVAHCQLYRHESGLYSADCTRCLASLADYVRQADAVLWAREHEKVCPRSESIEPE